MKEQSTYVFCRPEYTGEEDYIEPKKYTCCNCGTRLEKTDLVKHASECDVKEQIEAEIIENEQEDIAPLEIPTVRKLKVKLKEYKYTPPKKVKALWLGQTDGDIECKNAVSLYIDYEFVGVENKSKRFSLYYESWKPVAIWGTHSCSLSDDDDYYIFESARDLYLWMAEGEE